MGTKIGMGIGIPNAQGGGGDPSVFTVGVTTEILVKLTASQNNYIIKSTGGTLKMIS